jgi:hypothetical protein
MGSAEVTVNATAPGPVTVALRLVSLTSAVSRERALLQVAGHNPHKKSVHVG